MKRGAGIYIALGVLFLAYKESAAEITNPEDQFYQALSCFGVFSRMKDVPTVRLIKKNAYSRALQLRTNQTKTEMEEYLKKLDGRILSKNRRDIENVEEMIGRCWEDFGPGGRFDERK